MFFQPPMHANARQFSIRVYWRQFAVVVLSGQYIGTNAKMGCHSGERGMKQSTPILIFLFLLSCGRVPQSRYFTLDYSLPQKIGADGRGVLFVQSFTADDVHAQDKLIYRPSEYEVKFDHYRRWISSPTEMLTKRATEYLRELAVFSRVTLVPPRSKKFMILSANVQQFDEVYSKDGHFAKVALWAEVEDSEHGNNLWEGLLAAEEMVAANSPEGIVKAMSEATRKVLDQLGEKLKAIR